MYESKKINVMRTDTSSPGVDWCNEAYENADIIIYRNYFLRKVTEGSGNVVNFSSIVVGQTNIGFFQITIKKDTGYISSIYKNISVS